ncbi:SMP-30/gluconolactonase/LRE family protein [Streptomyces sp. NPDC057236]|uniref:SMP-30/gluconolactonase/LRE family protein n=1 Tax=Streptomyces sp. NPDC057236 TaxID=3346059 RepID=UPI0036336507
MRIARKPGRPAAFGLALAGLLALSPAGPAAAAPDTARGLTVTDAVTLPGSKVYPEGVALDPRTGDTYITSFATGAVYRAPKGQTQAEVFLPEGTDGRDTAMGTDVDGQGRLWVNDRDAVTLYDTATGARLARFVTPTPGQSVLNDLDLTPDGTAYITDSLRQLVYRVTPRQITDAVTAGGGDRTLSTGFDLNSLVAPHAEGTITLNGIESDHTGGFLITVDMATGDLFRLDPATGGAVKVAVKGGSGLATADGLLLEKDQLWIAHFGTDMISRLTLSHDGTAASVDKQLGNTALQHPTTMVRKDGSIHVVRSQFGSATLDLPFNIGRISGI